MIDQKAYIEELKTQLDCLKNIEKNFNSWYDAIEEKNINRQNTILLTLKENLNLFQNLEQKRMDYNAFFSSLNPQFQGKLSEILIFFTPENQKILQDLIFQWENINLNISHKKFLIQLRIQLAGEVLSLMGYHEEEKFSLFKKRFSFANKNPVFINKEI